MTDINENQENEKEPLNSSENKPQEPLISPKNDDELIIEIDDKQDIVASEDTAPQTNENIVSDYSKEELEPANEELTEEQPKAETKAQRIARLKKEKNKKPEKPIKVSDDDKTKSKSKLGLIVIVTLFVIVATAAYLFVINPKILAKHFPSLVEKGIITVESDDKNNNATSDKQTTETDKIGDAETNTTEDADNTVTESEEKVVEAITNTLKSEPTPKKTETPKSERVTSKGKLQTPCWIISYSSISNEATAIKTVANLSTQGAKCGYYWIPDYVQGGPKLFKVYIGPYNTKEAASADLPKIKEEASGAYVAEVK